MDFIIHAEKNNIKTISFVDHWINISKRFLHTIKYTYPDIIWVIDDIAKKTAVNEGISEDKIIVYENPYYSFLRKFRPRVSKKLYYIN